jgi:tetratricopeptide (TPR) repeat protein
MTESHSELQDKLETLERKHAENPEGRYFVPLANEYRKAGEVERAEHLLREGLKLHPEYLSAHIVLGRCLADLHKSREAAEEFRYVLSIDPQNLIALRTLGELAVAEGRGEEAERWYQDLLAVDPMNEDARRALDALSADEVEEGLAAETISGIEAGTYDPVGWEVADEPELPEHLDLPDPSDDEMPFAAAALPTSEDEGFDAERFYGGNIDLEGPGADAEAAPVEEWDADAETSADPDAEDVVTETIAELYSRQGFYDRAAEVYRELIRRGGAPGLVERLEEMERLAAAEEEAEPELPPLAVGEPEDDQAPDDLEMVEIEPELPEYEEAEAEGELVLLDDSAASVDSEDAFAASFVNGFEGGGPEHAAEPSAAPDPATRSALTVAEYLGELLAWRPAAAPDEPLILSPTAEMEEPVAVEEGGATDEDLLPWEFSASEEPAADEPEAPVEPPAPQRAEAPSAEPAEDAGDLESFQAWLRSLKR